MFFYVVIKRCSDDLPGCPTRCCFLAQYVVIIRCSDDLPGCPTQCCFLAHYDGERGTSPHMLILCNEYVTNSRGRSGCHQHGCTITTVRYYYRTSVLDGLSERRNVRRGCEDVKEECVFVRVGLAANGGCCSLYLLTLTYGSKGARQKNLESSRHTCRCCAGRCRNRLHPIATKCHWQPRLRESQPEKPILIHMSPC